MQQLAWTSPVLLYPWAKIIIRITVHMVSPSISRMPGKVHTWKLGNKSNNISKQSANISRIKPNSNNISRRTASQRRCQDSACFQRSVPLGTASSPMHSPINIHTECSNIFLIFADFMKTSLIFYILVDARKRKNSMHLHIVVPVLK